MLHFSSALGLFDQRASRTVAAIKMGRDDMSSPEIQNDSASNTAGTVRVPQVFVPFSEPVVPGVFLARRHRFLADLQLSDGGLVTAHCPNTGSLKSCLVPGSPALAWDSGNSKRKYRLTWIAVKLGTTWAGIDTGLPNRLVAQAIAAGAIPALADYEVIERERPMGASSRVDLLLSRNSDRCYVEVKNVTLVEHGVARFPDAITSRGLKHLCELEAMVRQGHRAAMVYVVQRSDGRAFHPAWDIDPEYALRLGQVHAAGVEVYVLGTEVLETGVAVTGLLPWTAHEENS